MLMYTKIKDHIIPKLETITKIQLAGMIISGFIVLIYVTLFFTWGVSENGKEMNPHLKLDHDSINWIIYQISLKCSVIFVWLWLTFDDIKGSFECSICDLWTNGKNKRGYVNTFWYKVRIPCELLFWSLIGLFWFEDFIFDYKISNYFNIESIRILFLAVLLYTGIIVTTKIYLKAYKDNWIKRI